MNSRFALLDVIKSQKTSKGKGAEDTLKLTNELKIITAPDDIFNLWSEVISGAAHGKLVDPDKMLKFNDKASWKPETGNLSHKFFRWLGNLSFEDLAKLAKHILNHDTGKRNLRYLKVTIKATSSVLESCYTAKEWVERRKRKYLVTKELHILDPTLGLLNALNEINDEKWREFKRDRYITNATMNVLIEQPGDDYWKNTKQIKSKNKTAADISPYAP